MNGRTIFTAALAMLGLLAIGAGMAVAQDVNVNYVPGTDFSTYKTCKWVEIQGAEKPDQIVDTRIKQAIAKDAVLTCVRSYRESIAEFSQLNTLEL